MYNTHIFCCTNRREAGNSRGSCAEKGSEELQAYFKRRVKELGIPKARVNKSGCLDCCEQGPTIVIYPQGAWYSCKTKEDVDEVIQQHLLQGKPVERLLIKAAQ